MRVGCNFTAETYKASLGSSHGTLKEGQTQYEFGRRKYAQDVRHFVLWKPRTRWGESNTVCTGRVTGVVARKVAVGMVDGVRDTFGRSGGGASICRTHCRHHLSIPRSWPLAGQRMPVTLSFWPPTENRADSGNELGKLESPFMKEVVGHMDPPAFLGPHGTKLVCSYLADVGTTADGRVVV